MPSGAKQQNAPTRLFRHVQGAGVHTAWCDQLLTRRVRIVHSTGFHSISACCIGCSCLQPMSQHHLACTQHYGAPYGSSP